MAFTDNDGEVITSRSRFKSPYNHNTEIESRKGALVTTEPSLTQQHQEKEANINNIVRNFGLTGKLPTINLPPLLDEFSDVFDFQSALNTIAAAKNAFMQLPAEVRSRFHNDPHEFVGHVDQVLVSGDEHEVENLRRMGLVVPKERIQTPPATSSSPGTPAPAGGVPQPPAGANGPQNGPVT